MNKTKRTIFVLSILIAVALSSIAIFMTTFKKQETITVGVIDSDMSQEYVTKYNVSNILHNYKPIYNTNTHADMVVDVIKNNDKNCEIFLANVINEDMLCDINKVIEALKWLNEFNVDIICMSITTFNDYPELKSIIQEIQAKDIIIVSACLNYSDIETYPAAYDGVISVSNCYNANASISIIDTNLKNKFKDSKWKECSTSILTAFVTGEISKQMSCRKFNLANYIKKYSTI